MDGPGIDQKIRFGYAKAAEKLGQPFQLYRPTSMIDPLDVANLIGNINAVATVQWDWMKANKPGNAIWSLVVDGQTSSYPLSAQEGDFLIGDTTFFVLSKQYQMPMLGCECNALITIKRPNQSLATGLQPYAGYLDSDSPGHVQNMPASILLMGRQGQIAKSKLPTDTYQPIYMVQIPNIDNTEIRTGDIISQQPGNTSHTMENFIVMITEQTKFGWRLTAQQVLN